MARQDIVFEPKPTAYDDLVWLHEHGALAGVAEVIRERRRQIEAIGWTLELDDALVHGSLATMAATRVNKLRASRRDGTADVGSDEEYLREAGALLAAEIDRLNRAFSAQETASILADPETMDAIREGESDQR
jgi:hypothetical protein